MIFLDRLGELSNQKGVRMVGSTHNNIAKSAFSSWKKKITLSLYKVIQLGNQMDNVLDSKPCQTPKGKTRSRFNVTKERSNSSLQDRTRASFACLPTQDYQRYIQLGHTCYGYQKIYQLKYIVHALISQIFRSPFSISHFSFSKIHLLSNQTYCHSQLPTKTVILLCKELSTTKSLDIVIQKQGD